MWLLPCFQLGLLSSWLRTKGRFCGLFWFVVIPCGCCCCCGLFGVKIEPPGWSILRGDSGEIFVNLKGRLEVNIGYITLLVDSVQPDRT